MKLSVMSTMLFLAMTLTACAASNGTSDTPAEAVSMKPWRIALKSSGGFAGRGAGNYTIDSTGKIEVTTTSGKTCSYRATEAELARFADLVARAKAKEWKSSYAPADRCCDRIEYGLTLEQGGVAHETEWIDQPDPMPEELTALWMALTGGAGESLRNAYEQRCR
jgi:hypothetical protein